MSQKDPKLIFHVQKVRSIKFLIWPSGVVQFELNPTYPSKTSLKVAFFH
jgi:hypothetical protein